MKDFLLAVFALIFVTSGYEASIPYFARTRKVTSTAPDKQNYFVIDADVWKYAQPELSDLRLYDGQSQVPYVIRQQSGGSMTHESQAKVLNLGEVGGHTEFELDTSGFDEYDRVRLQLDAKDFINSAQIEGRRALNDRSGTRLGTSTLYDFTKEGLGSNVVLKFPSASFRYLHVRLTPGIRPDQVKGAYLSSFSETKAAWINAGDCSASQSRPKQSVFDCVLNDGMPVERITAELGTGDHRIMTSPGALPINFNRTLVVTDESGNEIGRGSISSVMMRRGNENVFNQNLSIDLYSRVSKSFKVVVENGDDAPIPIFRIRPLSIARWMYFDPKGKTSLHLYYGDAKLDAPSYDYARFFHQTPDPALAKLGIPETNPEFTARPDDRPWSERHSYLLWAAMLLAVVVLGGLALRGLKGNTAAPLI